MIKKVLGPPGTGKTMTLLNEVNNYLVKGVPLNKIGYFAFTRKAAAEARSASAPTEYSREQHLTSTRILESMAHNSRVHRTYTCAIYETCSVVQPLESRGPRCRECSRTSR